MNFLITTSLVLYHQVSRSWALFNYCMYIFIDHWNIFSKSFYFLHFPIIYKYFVRYSVSSITVRLRTTVYLVLFQQKFGRTSLSRTTCCKCMTSSLCFYLYVILNSFVVFILHSQRLKFLLDACTVISETITSLMPQETWERRTMLPYSEFLCSYLVASKAHQTFWTELHYLVLTLLL